MQDQGMLIVKCDTGKASDGYHTFDELYRHRILLFIALMKSNPKMSWRSLCHSDKTSHEGWFIAGMELPTGSITYHIPEEQWTLLHGIEVKNQAPAWDGHTSKDVCDRLEAWAEAGI